MRAIWVDIDFQWLDANRDNTGWVRKNGAWAQERAWEQIGDNLGTGLQLEEWRGTTINSETFFDNATPVGVACVQLNANNFYPGDNASIGNSWCTGLSVTANSGAANAQNLYLMDGFFRSITLSGSGQYPALTSGEPVYLDNSSGRLTSTIPTASGSFVRLMGRMISADTIHWCPSVNWVEVV